MSMVGEQSVWLRDLSVSGMGFVHNQALPLGSFLVVRFERDGGDSIAVLVEVTRSKQVAATSFEIGTRIERIVTRDEIAEADAA